MDADETVDFSFTLSDYDPGMTVTVALDGLVPADDTDLVPAATRAVTNYVFSPESANCTIHLKTTEGAKTCSVQLFAEANYYDASKVETIEQKTQVVYKGNITDLTQTVDIGKNRKYISFSNSSISVAGGYTISYNSITLSNNSYSDKNLTVGISITELLIFADSINENTEVTIKFTVNYQENNGKSQTKDVEIKKKISELKSFGLQKQN